jgi:hypothetical protein
MITINLDTDTDKHIISYNVLRSPLELSEVSPELYYYMTLTNELTKQEKTFTLMDSSPFIIEYILDPTIVNNPNWSVDYAEFIIDIVDNDTDEDLDNSIVNLNDYTGQNNYSLYVSDSTEPLETGILFVSKTEVSYDKYDQTSEYKTYKG